MYKKKKKTNWVRPLTSKIFIAMDTTKQLHCFTLTRKNLIGVGTNSWGCTISNELVFTQKTHVTREISYSFWHNASALSVKCWNTANNQLTQSESTVHIILPCAMYIELSRHTQSTLTLINMKAMYTEYWKDTASHCWHIVDPIVENTTSISC